MNLSTKFTFFIFFILFQGFENKTILKFKNHLKKHGKHRQNPIYIAVKEWEEQKKINARAEEVYSDPGLRSGRDVQNPDSITDTLFVSVMDRNPNPRKASENEGIPELRKVTANTYTISVYQTEESYRGIESGMDLKELINSGDNPLLGQCCSGITEKFKEKFKTKTMDKVNILSLVCFNAQGNFEVMKICSYDPDELEKFRFKLSYFAIKGAFREKGITNPTVLVNKNADYTENWSWRHQDKWNPTCSEFNKLSPVALSHSAAIEVSFMAMSFMFKKVKNAKVIFNGHEMEINGEFGSIVHNKENSQEKFDIFKLKFKFPSEHSVDGLLYDGEMLMYLSSKHVFSIDLIQDTSILSILLQGASLGQENWNEFFESLMISEWKQDPEFEYNIENEIDLNLLESIRDKGNKLKFVFNDVFRRSFFWYQGSETTPPCTLNVKRFILNYNSSFVMYHPVIMPNSQIELLKKAVINGEIEKEGNSKKMGNIGNRKVYFHTDRGKKCEKIKYVEEYEGDAKVEEETTLNITKYKVNFIRGTTKTTTYGYTTNPNIPTIKGHETLAANGRTSFDMSIVDGDNVPIDVRKRLVDQHKLIKQMVRDGEEEQGVDELGPAVVIGDTSKPSDGIGSITKTSSSSQSEESNASLDYKNSQGGSFSMKQGHASASSSTENS